MKTDKNGPVSDAAADRLRRRYPRSRLPRPLLILVLAVVAAIGLGWLIWAALFHSRPEVDAEIAAFTVISDTAIEVTVTVNRREPGRPVSCQVVAYAADLGTVGEQRVSVEAASVQLVDLRTRLVTLRRAATAKVQDCRLEG